MATSDDNHIV